MAFSSLELVERHFPTFYQSLLSFPAQLPGQTTSQFHWLKRTLSGRPTFVLSHRLEQLHRDYAIAAELQFYVGHSYNSMLTLLVCMPTEAGTLILSVNRVFTDQVAGFGSTLKKKIGRRQIVDALAKHFKELRTELERTNPNPGP